MGRTEHPVSVLLVEDEVLISALVAETLSDYGFVVHEVTTADEATGGTARQNYGRNSVGFRRSNTWRPFLNPISISGNAAMALVPLSVSRMIRSAGLPGAIP